MPRLLFYRDPDAAWQRTLLPWFRVWPREAWRQALPVVFLAPDSSTIAWVKHRLVQAGVPAFRLNQQGMDYFDTHHTADDVLDRIDPEALDQNVAAWAAFLWLLANSDIDFRALRAAQ